MYIYFNSLRMNCENSEFPKYLESFNKNQLLLYKKVLHKYSNNLIIIICIFKVNFRLIKYILRKITIN